MLDVLENDLQEENINNSVDDATIQDIISNIDLLIESYKTKKSIDDLSNISQQQFTGLLDYIRLNYFVPNKSILYKYIRGISNNGTISHQYNYYILSCLVDYYIYLCRDNNKIPSIYGFSQLVGVDNENIYGWQKVKDQYPDAFGIYKKLHNSYENGLENGAQSGKNPVGYIAALNHRFGWSSEGKTSVTVNINRTSDQIMSTYNQNFIENNSENGQ